MSLSSERSRTLTSLQGPASGSRAGLDSAGLPGKRAASQRLGPVMTPHLPSPEPVPLEGSRCRPAQSPSALCLFLGALCPVHPCPEAHTAPGTAESLRHGLSDLPLPGNASGSFLWSSGAAGASVRLAPLSRPAAQALHSWLSPPPAILPDSLHAQPPEQSRLGPGVSREGPPHHGVAQCPSTLRNMARTGTAATSVQPSAPSSTLARFLMASRSGH